MRPMSRLALPVSIWVFKGVTSREPLTNLLGGYVWARYWHFMSMVTLVGLSIVHVFMVLSVDPYSLRSMTTGGHSERFSPIARNARPFQCLLPKAAADDLDVPVVPRSETRP